MCRNSPEVVDRLNETFTSVTMESANRPPVLDGTNFDHWKAKMEAYMKAIDEDVWMACEIKYTPPTETDGATSKPKPSASYTPAEKTARAANSRALNILFTYVDTKEFHRISTCKVAKEAWDILVTTHEGTETVKQGKLQRVTTQFEMIRMKEDETFDEFYAKLNHIVNTSYSLVKELSESLECLTQERDDLKKEVVQLQTQNKCLEELNALNEGSKSLDKILEVQRVSNYRSGLGYDDSSSNFLKGGQNSHEKGK